MNRRKLLLKIYKKLYKAFGPQRWWPGETPFEVIIGAILTQNTNWQNVEKAIKNLKINIPLTPGRLQKISLKKLSKLIRPAGYYNIKADRLKTFVNFIVKKYNGNLNKMLNVRLDKLRSELLSIKGIGPETADSILLYAADKPVFVIDAYTRRILERHDIINKNADYHDIQKIFMNNLPHKAKLFNEYHALIVKTGKTHCRKAPDCGTCPLKSV